jgi:hypothetical protein
LGDRLLILRLTNIFGFEYGAFSRRTFMSYLLKSLKEQGRMTFDISGDSRKDFLPVANFVKIIKTILKQNVRGIYNMGSGSAIAVKELANAIALGYGNCEIDYTGDKDDSFAVDVKKLQGLGITLPREGEILNSFTEIGRRLKSA